MSKTPSAWVQRKLSAMRQIQQIAMELFDVHGYQAVTIESIARTAGVSPSSIYRYFGTKESIVLWDEHDRGLLASIAAGLRQSTTLSTVKAALDRVGAEVDALDPDSRQFIQRRIAYIQQESLLVEAMHQQAHAMTTQLAGVLSQHENTTGNELENKVVASAVGQAVLYAILTWANEESESLSGLLDRSFAALDERLRFDP